jgi:putative flippase GtrA
MWVALRYGIVSAMGAVVQVATVALLGRITLMRPTTTAFLSVAAAVVHNFVWHERWTWLSRPARSGSTLVRLGAYAGSNGAVSAVVGVASAVLLAHVRAIGPVGASMLAIASAGAINYWVARRVIWRSETGRGR